MNYSQFTERNYIVVYVECGFGPMSGALDFSIIVLLFAGIGYWIHKFTIHCVFNA